MSTATRLADDFDSIRQRIAELEAEKKPAEAPKSWPEYSPVDVSFTAQDYDPA